MDDFFNTMVFDIPKEKKEKDDVVFIFNSIKKETKKEVKVKKEASQEELDRTEEKKRIKEENIRIHNENFRKKEERKLKNTPKP